MSIDAAKVGFWSSQTDTDFNKFFVGSGTFVSATRILTARHLFFDAQTGQKRPLWVRPLVNAGHSYPAQEPVFDSAGLDIALTGIDCCPDEAWARELDARHKAEAARSGWTLESMFEGRPQRVAAIHVEAFDATAMHYVMDYRPAPGSSGGAICADGRIWGIVTSQYAAAHTNKGCLIAVHQFIDWLRPLLPQSPVLQPLSAQCPPGISAAAVQLWQRLFDKEQAGWRSVQAQGLADIFQAKCAKRNAQSVQKGQTENCWPAWQSSAAGFFHFCLQAQPDGEQLVYELVGVLTLFAVTNPHTALQEPAREVLLALCTVAIERWVHREADLAPWLPPRLDAGIELGINDEWAVYLIAAAAHKLKSRLTPELGRAPPGLIMVNLPIMDIYKDTLQPVDSALASAFRGTAVINPNSRHVQQLVEPLKDKLQSDLVLGVRSGQQGNPLLNPKLRSEAWARYEIPIVEFGSSNDCAKTLLQFAGQLRDLITDLNLLLYPANQNRESA
jgi:hypothetical protein